MEHRGIEASLGWYVYEGGTCIVDPNLSFVMMRARYMNTLSTGVDPNPSATAEVEVVCLTFRSTFFGRLYLAMPELYQLLISHTD